MLANTPEQQIHQFTAKGNHIGAWLFSAYSLLAGGRVLIKNYSLVDHILDETLPDEARTLQAAFLLYGFAIESLLKAAFLKRGGKLVTDNKFKPTDNIGNHNLVQLAEKSNISMSNDEKNLLKKLSIQIKGFARYPTGKDWSTEEPIKTGNNENLYPQSFEPHNIKTLENFITKIGNNLGRDLSNSSLSPLR